MTSTVFSEKSIFFIYFEAFYLITTTITTIGYGDYSAFDPEEAVWIPEMLYLYFVTLMG